MKKIEHLGIAVKDIHAANNLYESLLGIPPYKMEEVETEGQDLGQMNKILMEKVEELTLHLINQNKRIKELEEKITNQETKK